MRYSIIIPLSVIPQSCKEIKRMHPDAQDGEYVLWYSKCTLYIKIYCYNMMANPSEYLTLPAGKRRNYIYKGNGSYPSWGAPCRGEFSKVRLVLTYPPKILMKDKTFMTTNHQQCSPSGHDGIAGIDGYGIAGDCSGPKGTTGNFSIDLSGTFVRISKNTTWEETGWEPSMKNYINSDNGQVVSANCGGYCGRCIPTSGETYLPLDLRGDHFRPCLAREQGLLLTQEKILNQEHAFTNTNTNSKTLHFLRVLLLLHVLVSKCVVFSISLIVSHLKSSQSQLCKLRKWLMLTYDYPFKKHSVLTIKFESLLSNKHFSELLIEKVFASVVIEQNFCDTFTIFCAICKTLFS